MNRKTFRLASVAAVVALACGPALAVTTWQFSSASVVSGAFQLSAGGVASTATGWADTGTGTPRNIEQQLATGNFVRYSGGLGINNLDGCGTTSSSTCSGDAGDVLSSAPEHAVDNDQRNEMILLQFSEKVNLTALNFGWVGSDADFTVLAYQGSGNSSLAGKTWSTLDAGWKLVGNYSNTTTGAKSLSSNSEPTYYSSFWLIGAYNPLGGAANSAYSGSDYLKLASVTGNTCTSTTPGCGGGNVPEPSSLLLIGVGLLGLLRMRRT